MWPGRVHRKKVMSGFESNRAWLVLRPVRSVMGVEAALARVILFSPAELNPFLV